MDTSDNCDECYIPLFENKTDYDFPSYPDELEELICEFKDRFLTIPGVLTFHVIEFLRAIITLVEYLLGECLYIINSM